MADAHAGDGMRRAMGSVKAGTLVRPSWSPSAIPASADATFVRSAFDLRVPSGQFRLGSERLVVRIFVGTPEHGETIANGVGVGVGAQDDCKVTVVEVTLMFTQLSGNQLLPAIMCWQKGLNGENLHRTDEPALGGLSLPANEQQSRPLFGPFSDMKHGGNACAPKKTAIFSVSFVLRGDCARQLVLPRWLTLPLP